jgi:hypothetical protein
MLRSLGGSIGKDTVVEEKDALPETSAEEEARRQFLARCGRFAVVTPPTMALFVSVAAAPDEARASTILGKKPKKPKKPKPPKPDDSILPF